MIRLFRKLVFVLGALLLPLAASGATVFSRAYSFNLPVVAQREGFSRITLDETTPFVQARAPVLPCMLVNVPLPCGIDDLQLEASPTDIQSSPLPSPPEFGRPPRFVRSGLSASPDRGPDPDIYSSDAFYPPCDAEIASVQQSGEKGLFASTPCASIP